MVSRTVERAIYEKYKGVCVICGEKTTFDKGEVDHIKPKAKGGTDKPKNLQWLCHRCNKLKGSTRTNKEVKELLGIEEPPKPPTRPTGIDPKKIKEYL
jgi:5-methylcytosine-specific restriction endonuclease McrA